MLNVPYASAGESFAASARSESTGGTAGSALRTYESGFVERMSLRKPWPVTLTA